MAKESLPIRFIKIEATAEHFNGKKPKIQYLWKVVDRRRKTGKKDNVLYYSTGYNNRSAARKAAKKHNEGLREKLEVL